MLCSSTSTCARARRSVLAGHTWGADGPIQECGIRIPRVRRRSNSINKMKLSFEGMPIRAGRLSERDTIMPIRAGRLSER